MPNRKYAARDIHLYIQARYAADSVSEQRHLQYMCWGISRLLGHLLHEDPSWGPDRWLDRIIPVKVIVESEHVLKFHGFAVWGLISQIWKEWVEPVEVIVRLSSTGRRMPYFRAKLGDAGVGLGTVALAVREQLIIRAHPERHRLYFGDPSGKWIFEVGD